MLAKSQLAAACAAAFAIATGSAFAQQVPAGYPADYQKILDGAKKEGKVVIYSTTDTKAAGPIIKGFEALYPGVKVEYNDMNSTELYNRYISEQAAGGGSGDIVWSSSMDSALKLATDYALKYKSPESGKLPAWAVWKDSAYGTTYEPAVFIYNKRLIPANEVPTTHAALAQLVSSQPDKFKNKVTTYDIEKSAVGFMLAVQDKANDPKYFETLKGIGSGGLIVQSSTGTMMERVSSGENLIGYNILAPTPRPAPRPIPRWAWPTPPTTRWCCRAWPSSARRPRTRTPPGCGWTTCCPRRARGSWPTRPTWPPCATTSKAITTWTA